MLGFNCFCSNCVGFWNGLVFLVKVFFLNVLFLVWLLLRFILLIECKLELVRVFCFLFIFFDLVDFFNGFLEFLVMSFIGGSFLLFVRKELIFCFWGRNEDVFVVRNCWFFIWGSFGRFDGILLCLKFWNIGLLMVLYFFFIGGNFVWCVCVLFVKYLFVIMLFFVLLIVI